MTGYDFDNIDLNGLKAAATQATAQDVDNNIGMSMALIMAELKRASDGSVFTLKAITDRLVASLQNGQGLVATAALPSVQDTPLPSLPSGTNPTQVTKEDSVNTEPSVAEKLGIQLLQLVGNDPVKANQIVQFTGRAMAHEVRFFPYMGQELDKLTRKDHPDTLVETAREGLVMKSLLDLRTAKDELKHAKDMLDLLVEAVTGQAIANETPRDAANRARREIADLKKNTSLDALLKIIADAVSVTRGTEDLPTYVANIVTAINAKSSPVVKDESKYFNAIKNVTKIDPIAGEPFDTYFTRVYKMLKDDSAVTKLLDEIGTALGVERQNRNNSDYKTALVGELARYVGNSNSFLKHYSKLEEFASANGITPAANEGATSLAKRIILHNRRVGSGIKGIA